MDGRHPPAEDGLVLAETIKLSSGEVTVILLVLLGMVIVFVGTLTLGCLWAWRAGQGSQLALGGWVVCGTLEGLLMLTSLPGLATGRPNLLAGVPAGALAAQVALFLVARDRRQHP